MLLEQEEVLWLLLLSGDDLWSDKIRSMPGRGGVRVGVCGRERVEHKYKSDKILTLKKKKTNGKSRKIQLKKG